MSSTAASRTWEGRVIDGKFPLQQWLGGSEASTVFVTVHPQDSSQKAAIKLIAGGDAAAADGQLASWRPATLISHPNLIRIFETGRCQLDGRTFLYVVMELADENLAQILPERALTASEVSELLPPVLAALSHLHSAGFVHGRVRPANVMAIKDQVKLSADQLTPIKGDRSAKTRRDVYDAPEVAAGIISPEVDAWSVGATLVAALTQNVSFAEDASQGNAGLPRSIPEPFRTIASECLRLDPQRRCSIADIRRRLQTNAAVTPGGVGPAATPSSVAPNKVAAVRSPAPVRAANRKPAFVILLIAAVLAGIVFLLLRGKRETERSSSAQSAPQSAAPVASQPAPPAGKVNDSKGAVVQQVLPDIPADARNTITGTIKIAARVEVDASGKVSSVRLTSAGPSRYFASRVLTAAYKWEFSSPRVNGQPLASVWMLRFRLRRGGTQATAEQVKR